MQAHPTIDQLEVFLAVVEAGGFSAASRRLNRAQSAISYAIANLEAQLDLALFERGGAKRPQLTEAGKAIAGDARRLLADLDLLRARARGLNDGLEGEVSVAISTLTPSEVVVEALRGFRDRFPTVSLNVTVGELGEVVRNVADERATVGFGGTVDGLNPNVATELIGHSSMRPVAAPDHPLARRGRELTADDVREEIQIVVTDASGLTRGRDFNVLSFRAWRVNNLSAKRSLILGGLGWGGLPTSMVREDLEAGRLVSLPLTAYRQNEYPIQAVTKPSNPPGPAARWLIAAFRDAFTGCEGLTGRSGAKTGG